MKKIIYSIFVLAVMLVTTTSVNAATFSFSPSTGTFAPGEEFSVEIYVNPDASEEITVAKIESEFSNLEVVSFTQANGWIALPVPGSDLIDNSNGSLIKIGGFPSKVTEKKLFGTVLFKAKDVSTATFNSVDGSMMLNASNEDKYEASSAARFSIVKPVVEPVVVNNSDTETEPKPKTETKPTVKHPVSPVVPVVSEIKEVTKEATSTLAVDVELPETATSTLETELSDIATSTLVVENESNSEEINKNLASAVSGADSGTPWYYIVLALILAVLGGAFFLRKRRSS